MLVLQFREVFVKRILCTCVCMAAVAALLVPTSGRADEAPVTLAAKMPIGGDGGWDFIKFDPDGKRLFVSRGSHVQVVDAVGDTVIGDIPNTPGVHGIALDPETGHGFTSNGRDSSVTVFDLKTLATITTIKLQQRGPDAILYDPASKRVFTCNGGSNNATAIDPATNQVLGTVEFEGNPEVPVSDGRGHVFVNIEDKSKLVCFDAKTLKVLSSWPLAPGEEPTGLAIDLAHGRLFSACANKKLIVLEASSGRRVADLPIGERVDGDAFDPALGLVFCTNGEGTLSVIHEDSPDKYTKLADVPTQRGARTVTLDEAAHRVYTCTATYGETPAATPEQPRPRPKMVPGTFVILALDAKAAPAAAH